MQNFIRQTGAPGELDTNRPFVCGVCLADFKRQQDLSRHAHVHREDYKCMVDCQKTFATKAGFQRHMVEQHPGIVFCPCCGLTFLTLSHLYSHQMTNCAGIFGQVQRPQNGMMDFNLNNTNLKTPQTGVPSHQKKNLCLVCGKMFGSSFYLKTHMRIHTGDKPYQCVVCEKRFTQLSSLKTHKRIHSGEKPYTCKTCGRGFSVRLYLQSHQRTHTGERPYKCKVCGNSYTQQSSLNTHTKQHNHYV